MFFIFVSSITLVLGNPLTDPDSMKVYVIDKIDFCLTLVFIGEFLLKIIAYGFAFNGKDSYIRNSWNVLDFVIVVSSVSHFSIILFF